MVESYNKYKCGGHFAGLECPKELFEGVEKYGQVTRKCASWNVC